MRKLALRRSLAGNPIAFATEAFEPTALASLVDAVTARVKEDQLREDLHSPRWQVLEAYQHGQTITVPDGGDAENIVLAFLGRRLTRAATERRAA